LIDTSLGYLLTKKVGLHKQQEEEEEEEEVVVAG
jgi:hypothetical protein